MPTLDFTNNCADILIANVDEVFIDLCRQIIRRDNAGVLHKEEVDLHPGYGYNRKPTARDIRRDERRRRRKHDKSCTIL